jgi:hypothetical protein
LQTARTTDHDLFGMPKFGKPLLQPPVDEPGPQS